MQAKNLFVLALILTCSWVYCDETTKQKIQSQGLDMNHSIEHQSEKFFIGLELRTNNEECSSAMPAHKDKFFKENIVSKIPNKTNGNILALYTDYEGDHTKPYSWILGCEVSSLDQVPEGLVGKIIPESKYAIFTSQGEFPQGLIAAWQNIWKSDLPRSYTSDFEVYRSDFDPQRNPEVKVYIGIENSLLQSVLQGRLVHCQGRICRYDCVKAPGLNDRKRGSMYPIQPLFRSFNRGSFHAAITVNSTLTMY